MQSKFLSVATIIIFSTFNIAVSQTQKRIQNTKVQAERILFSPPDKTFSIEVPVRLKEDKDQYKEEQSMKSIRVFGGFTHKMAFLVYATTYKHGDKSINEIPKEKLGGLEFLVGGDDDHDFAERFIVIDGFPTREVIYKNQNAKGIMIDVGQQVFILCLAVKNRRDLESKVANRFFSSFHLIRESKKDKPSKQKKATRNRKINRKSQI